MTKLLFVHGYTASSQADWYPAIIPILKEHGIDFRIPDLPGGTRPNSNEWLEIISREFSALGEDTILIGHSLGTRAILLFLDKFPVKVAGVLLVAPLSNETKNAFRRDGEAYPDFFDEKLDLTKLKMRTPKIVIMHSLDDDSLDYRDHGVKLAEEIGCKLLTYNKRRHFCNPKNAPAIFDVLEKEFLIKA